MVRQFLLWLVFIVRCMHSVDIGSVKRTYKSIANIALDTTRTNSTLYLLEIQLEKTEVYILSPMFVNKHNDCASLYRDGYTESGVYNIWLTTGYRFLPIYCDMETRHHRTNKRGWMVIQRRYNGELNFNRTWQEYVDGFGSPHGEYWIGLENIYQLAGYTSGLLNDRSLQIHLLDRIGVHVKVHYEGFEINDSAHAYMLGEPGLVSSTTPHVVNGLLASNWQKFSTYDMNNIKKSRGINCAQLAGGGWWFNMGCSWSNLNAQYTKTNEKMSKLTLYWKDWNEIKPDSSITNNALTEVSMKIQ